jgi:hypothetical protein
VRGYSGLETCSVEDALEVAADVLAAHPRRLLLVSPFLTQEEGAAALELARALGVAPSFLSPPANGLADDLLHTGDPCPNRRGLTELGFAPLEPAAALRELAAAGAAVLAGERVLELAGAGLAELPASLRLVAFDVAMADVPALDVGVSVPTRVEKSGRWVNVDGIERRLDVAVPPPRGVRRLETTLAELARACARAAEGSSRP